MDKNRVYPDDLSDDEWDLIKHLYSFHLKAAISAAPKPRASTIKNWFE